MKKINVDTRIKLRGLYKLVVTDDTGKVTKQIGPFENLITNAGLDLFWNGGPSLSSLGKFFIDGAFVGSGNTAPAVTDTTMTALVASVGNYNNPISNSAPLVYNAGPPPYSSVTFTAVFPAGTATGTLAEVGIGNNSTSPYTLFSHALIVDGSGNPTTITVLSNEQLTLTYTLELYWNTTIQSGNISISGTTYALQWLPYNINGFTGNPSYCLGSNTWASLAGYSGVIGTPTTPPSGIYAAAANLPTAPTYISGNYYNTLTYTAALGDLNFTGGIGTLIVSGAWHSFQIGFTPNIPKNNTYTLTFVCNVAWARYP